MIDKLVLVRENEILKALPLNTTNHALNHASYSSYYFCQLLLHYTRYWLKKEYSVSYEIY